MFVIASYLFFDYFDFVICFFFLYLYSSSSSYWKLFKKYSNNNNVNFSFIIITLKKVMSILLLVFSSFHSSLSLAHCSTILQIITTPTIITSESLSKYTNKHTLTCVDFVLIWCVDSHWATLQPLYYYYYLHLQQLT